MPPLSVSAPLLSETFTACHIGNSINRMIKTISATLKKSNARSPPDLRITAHSSSPETNHYIPNPGPTGLIRIAERMNPFPTINEGKPPPPASGTPPPRRSRGTEDKPPASRPPSFKRGLGLSCPVYTHSSPGGLGATAPMFNRAGGVYAGAGGKSEAAAGEMQTRPGAARNFRRNSDAVPP